ncbi:PilZ domain-containing protein [Maridesulfovibrio hydrothermalis]|uniref:PilZ domain-containing protein n=1 Tax=Maridesulfovibrio hydrothermalis AM13 = DSM 14728 TaxID=1121451 RepID=L0R649_9BACT|nr:PilZ domain-containing protein [Maridesulfovibrio hydrothermalis]CCO22168.1 conserved protein of unknown function [Maridesulfovibrio hydrothermalis AM13 = DSM 14728]
MLQQNNQIIVFTDNPAAYDQTELTEHIDVEFCSCPDSICCAMLEKNYSGMILDMRKMMQTPCCKRDRILSLSAKTPIMRTLEEADRPICLDDHEDFICRCLKQCCIRTGSSCAISVSIPVEISLENDPAMRTTVTGTIHDLFEHGCTFHTDADLSGHTFLHLKISSLTNKLPIYAGVCREQTDLDCSCGYKVKFLDIKEDQSRELSDNIPPSESADPVRQPLIK